MDKISATEPCQKLKSEAIARQDTSAFNNLRSRILDYFINRNVPDDMFTGALQARLNETDPVKEQRKVIFAEIIEA